MYTHFNHLYTAFQDIFYSGIHRFQELYACVEKLSFLFDVALTEEHHLCYVHESYTVKLKLFEQRLRMTKWTDRNVWHTHYTSIFLFCLSMVMFCLVITIMDAHVTSKITRLSEAFIANFTIIWFITGVNMHMFLEIR